MAVALTPGNLAGYLNDLYPDRWPGHLDEIEELIEENLRPAGYTTVDEVADMLARTSDAFLAQEREDPPRGASGRRYHGVGAVRVSLKLDTVRATVDSEPMTPDPRRAPPGTFDTAEDVVAKLRSGAESAGARCADLDWYDTASGMAAGFALLPPPDQEPTAYTVVSFTKMLLPQIVEEGFWIYITGGVLHDPRGNRMDILEVCNTRNGEVPDFPAFVHPTSGDILVQQRLWSHVALGTPAWLELWARGVPIYVERLRSALATAGIEGTPYEWSFACALAAISISGTQRWTWATEPQPATRETPPLAGSVQVGTSTSTTSTTSTDTGNRACVTGSCEARGRRTSERICPSCGQVTQPRPNQSAR